MKNKLYVGNLPYSVTSESLKEMFAQYGEITDSRVIIFKDSGRSRGFGFVEFAKDEDAERAVSEMNQKEVEGRKLVVNIARPMEPRDNDGGDRGGYGSDTRGTNETAAPKNDDDDMSMPSDVDTAVASDDAETPAVDDEVVVADDTEVPADDAVVPAEDEKDDEAM